jgi:hypothetical protein
LAVFFPPIPKGVLPDALLLAKLLYRKSAREVLFNERKIFFASFAHTYFFVRKSAFVELFREYAVHRMLTII